MTAATKAHPRWAGVRQVIGSSRPLSWINTAYPFGAAYLLAGGGFDAAFVVGLCYFLVPYNLLMYGVNDVFDHASDAVNPRKGGAEGVVLDRTWHRTTIVAAVVVNVPFIVALLALGGPGSAALLAIAVFAVIAYSAPGLRFKERPVIDSLTSSTHFVAPAAFGIALTAGTFSGPVLWTLAAFFLWGAASHAFGAVQDVRADRTAGISSIATAFGARTTVWIALGSYAASALCMLATRPPAAVAALIPVAYGASIWPFRKIDDAHCEAAHAGWRRFLWLNYVAGFLITQGLLIALLA